MALSLFPKQEALMAQVFLAFRKLLVRDADHPLVEQRQRQVFPDVAGLILPYEGSDTSAPPAVWPDSPHLAAERLVLLLNAPATATV